MNDTSEFPGFAFIDDAFVPMMLCMFGAVRFLGLAST